MTNPRHFLNSPMLATEAAVEDYARQRGALAVAGYTGPDGTHRACLEITADEAGREIAAQALKVEQQAAALRAVAEGMRQ